MDRILLAQQLSVEDLSPVRPTGFSPPERTARDSMDIVPLVSQAVAMTALVIDGRLVLGSVHLPSDRLTRFPPRRAVSRRSWERFVGVRVTAAQALPMDPILRVGSIVVIDRHYNSLVTCRPPMPNLYAVRYGSQMLFRHAAFESSRLVLRPRALAYPVDLIELASQEAPSDLLVGRVCLSISEI
jgi:hypothetical protein